MLQKEIKDLTFEVFNPSHTERGWGGLESCQMFTDSVVVKTTDLLFIFRDVVCAGGQCWAVGIIIV